MRLYSNLEGGPTLAQPGLVRKKKRILNYNNPMQIKPMQTLNPILTEALRKCLGNLKEQIGEMHSLTDQRQLLFSGAKKIIIDVNHLTVAEERNEEWDRVRNAVSCLDSIRDMMRQALDAIADSINAPAAIAKILYCLGLPSRPPPIAGAFRGNPILRELPIYWSGKECIRTFPNCLRKSRETV
jgi:hypothetical protein